MKSKTGIVLCAIYIVLTIFCVIGFGHRNDLGWVVSILPVFPVGMLLKIIGINVHEDSIFDYILIVMITSLMLYFIGVYIELLVTKIKGNKGK